METLTHFTEGDTKDPYPDLTNPKDLLGVKKCPIHLVPPALVIEAAPALANGAAKYGAYNWREKQVKLSIYLAAAQRHLMAYWDGEEVAEDSGVGHLAHAAACLAIIFDAKAIDMLVDDRPVPGGAAGLMKKQDKTNQVEQVKRLEEELKSITYTAGETVEICHHAHINGGVCELNAGHTGRHGRVIR